MEPQRTTIAIQHYLDALGGAPEDAPADPLIRDLLGRAAERLRLLCVSLLHRSYPRLTQPLLNLHSDEMLSAVVERMLKALRNLRPRTVREFFALAGQHMRWELNDLARRLDERTAELPLPEAPAPESSGSLLGPLGRRILDAIEGLPEEEREAFSLVRIQGLTHNEAAGLLGVSAKTVQRRLNRGLLLLTEALSDLRTTQPS